MSCDPRVQIQSAADGTGPHSDGNDVPHQWHAGELEDPIRPKMVKTDGLSTAKGNPENRRKEQSSININCGVAAHFVTILLLK